MVVHQAHTPAHDSVLDQDQEVLRRVLPPGWRVRVQSAITTTDSEPEPDIAVVPGPANRYPSFYAAKLLKNSERWRTNPIYRTSEETFWMSRRTSNGWPLIWRRNGGRVPLAIGKD